MIKVGLTGNIGSGKTLVCQAFEAIGIPVFNADLEARKILNSKEIVEEIRSLFGNHVVDEKNEINRKALAAVVFKSAQELEKLNQLIHPKLRDTFNDWSLNHLEYQYIIQEAAILFENNFNEMMDKTITVSAPREIRLERVMKRDDAKMEDVLERMNSQWPDGKKEALSDFVIINDGNQMIIPQILEIHQKLSK